MINNKLLVHYSEQLATQLYILFLVSLSTMIISLITKQMFIVSSPRRDEGI